MPAPYFIDVSEDGKRGYVANSESANVSVIDLDKRLVLGNIRVGISPGLARVSPDGETVVVSNRGDDTVSLIDAGSSKCAGRSPLASSRRHRDPARQQQSVCGMRGFSSGRVHRFED